MSAQKYLLLIFTIGICNALLAQTSQQKKLLPMLAPPSPEVASLGRYGSYEVNLTTGVPNISIPIYEIKVGELSLPISINYHASGIKVTETPSRVGLGWSLDAGGMITRKIQGKPDEQTNNYFAATSTSSFRVRETSEINGNADSSLDYLSRVDTREYDGEPDIFSYNIPGHNGRFLLNQKDSFKPFLIPFSPVAVSKTYIDAITVHFTIKDEGGRAYSFNTVETTTSGSGVGLNANTTSAWLLSEMVSTNAQDSIHLKYSSVTTSDQYENEYFVINDNSQRTSGQNGHYTNDLGAFSGELVGVTTYSQRLDSILFLNGKIVFEGASEDRADFNGVYTILKRLKFIKVYNYDAISKTYGLVKIIQLFHSYFINGSDNSTKRLRLDSVQYQTPMGIPIQTYRLDYNTAVSLPGKLVKKKDYWGYFNNRTNTIPGTSTPTSIPKLKHTYAAPPGSPYDIWIGGTDTLARYPDPTYMQADVLQKITFPTGGYTQFEYETNQYLDENGNPKYAGGLRIKAIKSFTDSGRVPMVKTYRYGLNESGYGRANFFLEQCFFANHQNVRYVDTDNDPGGNCVGISSKTMHTYFANPTNDIEGSDGSPVFYSTVTEYEGDTATNIGKTVYQFADKADAKTSITGYGKPFFDSYQFTRGMQTGKAVYKAKGNGAYALVTEERAKYQFYPYQWTTQGIGIVVKKLVLDEGSSGIYDYIGLQHTSCQATFSDANNYSFNNYNIVSGDNKLVVDTVITYDQEDSLKSIVTVTAYTYDDSTHFGLIKTQRINSARDTLKTTYTYPYNYGSSPYTGMDSAHIWSSPVTETQFKGATQLVQQTTNYSSLAGNNYLPSTIGVQVRSNPSETRASFNSYDLRGNVLEMQKTNDIKQSFIWDYKNVHPIAEITNAARSNIAYTSFEADGNGGWTGISDLSFTIYGSVTGKRAYRQTGFSFSKTGLDSTLSYIVSYWSTDGSYTVNSSSGTSIKTKNGWTLYRHIITHPSGGTVTVSGSGSIDELRLLPSGSLLKTFSYEPLVGVSSTCDENDHLLNYYYDGFSRLSFIKDEDGNILKQYCYNYDGQTTACSIFGNTAQSGNYNKTCTSGLTGSQVTYTVPANTYYGSSQAEADTIAQYDVRANGQAFANLNGNCNPTIQGYNSKTSNYNVKFTNNSTNAWYAFTITNSTFSAYTLGSIPAGTYKVEFYPGGTPVSAVFNINGYTQSGVAATFYNISITTLSTASMY